MTKFGQWSLSKKTKCFTCQLVDQISHSIKAHSLHLDTCCEMKRKYFQLADYSVEKLFGYKFKAAWKAIVLLNDEEKCTEVMNIWKAYMWTAGWRIIWKKIIAVIAVRDVVIDTTFKFHTSMTFFQAFF